ncbi:hypothetical protein ACWGQ5_56875, partial [Streptomyces sp. NPDC055722]
MTLNDTKALEPIHQALHRRQSLPKQHYLDSGYRSAELIVGSAKTYGVALVTPVLLDTSRQAKAREGFAADDCTIDWPAQQATCPAGKTSATWNPVVHNGTSKTVVIFAALDCIPCPFNDQQPGRGQVRRPGNRWSVSNWLSEPERCSALGANRLRALVLNDRSRQPAWHVPPDAGRPGRKT